MNEQQRSIVFWMLLVLAAFSNVLALEVPFLESRVLRSDMSAINDLVGPDFLCFRARERTDRYTDEEVAEIMAESRLSRGQIKEKYSARERYNAAGRALMFMKGNPPTVPVHLTLSLAAGLGLPFVLISAAFIVRAGREEKTP